jgi:hypothetical protein
MLSYTLGPFLALLPKRWRESLPIIALLDWRPAMILSGLLESAVALDAWVYWYSYSVTHWADDAVRSAIEHGAKIDPNTVGFAALAVMGLHPLTWLIAYFGLEGMVRLCAALTDTSLGVLPLFLADWAYLRFIRRADPQTKEARGRFKSHLASGIRAVREKALTSTLPSVPDELQTTRTGSDEVLEIRACRAKADWTPPRVVRYEDRYYQLEMCSEGSSPRPFTYTLRRLSAGVPGRTVLIYSPAETPVLVDL